MEIELSNGGVALVDEADWNKVCEIVGVRNWRLFRNQHGNMYARCRVKRNGECREYLMHRLIMDAPKGLEVDHIDGNGLNNQRANLRLATSSQNHKNRRKPYGTSSYLGVSLTSTGRWRAQIRADGRIKHLGTFDDEVDAALAYDIAAVQYHGEWAAPNFPELLSV